MGNSFSNNRNNNRHNRRNRRIRLPNIEPIQVRPNRDNFLSISPTNRNIQNFRNQNNIDTNTSQINRLYNNMLSNRPPSPIFSPRNRPNTPIPRPIIPSVVRPLNNIRNRNNIEQDIDNNTIYNIYKKINEYVDEDLEKDHNEIKKIVNKKNINDIKIETCITCMDKIVEIAFIPCGHICMCKTCIKKYITQHFNKYYIKCKLFNKKINDIQKIYISGSSTILEKKNIENIYSENLLQKDKIEILSNFINIHKDNFIIDINIKMKILIIPQIILMMMNYINKINN